MGYDEHGNRLRKKVSGRTRAEVVEKLRKLHQQVDSGVVPDDRLTVRAFLDRWLALNLPGTVAESTEDDYVDTVRLHLIPALGPKRLAKLTVADLDRLWKAKRDAGYSSNSVRIMRTVLCRALGQACARGHRGPKRRLLVRCAAHQAKEGRTLTVSQDRDAASGRRTRLVVSELKTPKSRRLPVLTPELVARFRHHRLRQAEAQMAAGALWQDHGLIFASEVGTPMDPDNFSHSFARLCEWAGLGHWHPHELRHSGASLMLAQGTPLHVVSEVLGHASIAITEDVYGHLLEGDKRAAAESMSRALFGG